MSAVPANLHVTSPWRQALPAWLALTAIILLLYRDTGMAMVTIWSRSDTFAHAFLVPPISAWLVWRQRERLAAMTPKPWPWALLLMAAVAAIWLMADLVLVSAAAQFALVALLVLAVPAVLGLEVALAILFPLLFLFFAVPFGEFMLQPMMEWTADFVVGALQLTGIPVFREGLQFVIPTGSWSVIDECSGVRYLIASFMVGTLFAYLNYRSYWRRAVFMLVALLMPIVANWLRAYIIVMMGHLSGNKIAVGVDHLLYGWVFFGVVIFIMFIVGARWSEPDEAAHEGPPSWADGPGAQVRGRLTAMTAMPVVALLVALPHLALAALQRMESAAVEPKLELPASLASGWASEGARIVDWAPKYSNPSAQATRAFAGPSPAAGTVGVYVAYYRGQTSERKLVSSLNGVVGINDRIWNRIGSGARSVDANGNNVTFKTTDLLGPATAEATRRPHMVVWNAYWIDGRIVASDVRAKLAGALARLRGRGDEGAAIVLYANEATPAASAAALEAFVRANIAPLNIALQRTRDAR
jgi:exosortase A